MNDDLITRLRTRANIRRQIATRKSVQEGKPDRISDLLEEAAKALEEAHNENKLILQEMGAVLAEGQIQQRLKNTYLNQLLDLKRIHNI